MRAALDDDLNTPVGLAVLAELATVANELCDLAKKRRKDARFQGAAQQLAVSARDAIRAAGELLGVLQCDTAEYRRRTQALRLSFAARKQARVDKDFGKADSLRDELVELGVELADTPAGTVWHLAVV
jgi:cysteinyl-tRNA synthetase